MGQEVAQADYVFFLQNIFADGTLSKGDTAQVLLENLKQHRDYRPRLFTFLVTGREMLNDLAPIEVLAGQRFEGEPRVVVSAHLRVLERKIEERVIKVIYAARDYFEGPTY